MDRLGRGSAPLLPSPVEPIYEWDPGPVTWRLSLVAWLQLVASALMLAQAVHATEELDLRLIWLVVAAIAGWALADLISGRVHKWLDAYGNQDTPLFGHMVREFQHHHRCPMDSTRMHWQGALWGAARLTLPLSIVAVVWPDGPAGQVFRATLLTGLAVSQHSHNLAHIPSHRRPRWVRLLQSLRLFLCHRSHVKEHHHSPWDEYFEPLCGWWSRPIRRCGYNRAEERLLWYLFRLVPRTWLKPELAPPSYHREDLHWRSAWARWRYDRQHLDGQPKATATAQENRSAREWARILASYARSDDTAAAKELLYTIVPLIVLWIAAWAALDVGYWLTLAVAIPTSGFLVRLFIIQHDCGHYSFFERRWMNDWIGRAIGVLVLNPHDLWRRTHAAHHAGSGNLERRGKGDIPTWTTAEYVRMSWPQRLGYRLVRHPVVLFLIVPTYLFVFQYRLPIGYLRSDMKIWTSTMLTNLGIVGLFLALASLVGLAPLLLVHGPIVFVASVAGVWLFYIQHQFEHTYWASGKSWTFHEAAWEGSSHYDLPMPLRWLTANIGVHHVHHLCCRIPFYRLGLVLRDWPELRLINRITLRQSLLGLRFTLWDESRRRLVAFPNSPAGAGVGPRFDGHSGSS